MDGDLIAAGCAVILLQGGILIAAAKSIFVTKKEHYEFIKNFNNKIYDKGITVFVPRMEWENSRHDREIAQDTKQKNMCKKIDSMQHALEEMNKTQNKTNVAIGNLLGRLELKRKHD